MKRFFIILIMSAATLFLIVPDIRAVEKKLNLLGEEICPNSAGALLRDEIYGMQKDDSLVVIIETEKKEIIETAIKLEKLQVEYEEIDRDGKTTFIIKLK